MKDMDREAKRLAKGVRGNLRRATHKTPSVTKLNESKPSSSKLLTPKDKDPT
jgi:hypothetical protein